MTGRLYRGGKVVRIDRVTALMGRMRRNILLSLPWGGKFRPEAGLDQAMLQAFPGVKINRVDHRRLRVIPEKREPIAGFIKFFEDAGQPVYEAKIIRPTLEDVFVRITGIEIAKMKREKEGRRKR